jgi:hypothetical protein
MRIVVEITVINVVVNEIPFSFDRFASWRL